jgi:putative flippase GtrA
MNGFRTWLIDFIEPKLRYATASAIATVVDYTLYLGLVYTVLKPVPANIIATTCGIVINFFLQRRFVFNLQRKPEHAFALAMLVSLGALFLSTLIIYLLNLYPFFQTYQFVTKFVATGLVFFYNFHFKRFAFEKRFFHSRK